MHHECRGRGRLSDWAEQGGEEHCRDVENVVYYEFDVQLDQELLRGIQHTTASLWGREVIKDSQI